jgi:hypothetical protein
MSNPASGTSGRTTDRGLNGSSHRTVGVETKPSWLSTELWIYVLITVAILIASMVVGDDTGANRGGDYFTADKAWWYITLLTIGYLVSRGLAKSGSRSLASDPRERGGDVVDRH